MGSVRIGTLSANSMISVDDSWGDVSVESRGVSDTWWQMDGCKYILDFFLMVPEVSEPWSQL